MTLTITSSGSGAVTKTVTVVPGTLNCQDSSVDAGGETLPLIRTNLGVSGSCDVLLNTTDFTFADALALISAAGEGSYQISAPVNCSGALLDVKIAGAGAQVATLSWKGGSAAADD